MQPIFFCYILLKEETFSEGKKNSKTNLYLTLELAHLKQSVALKCNQYFFNYYILLKDETFSKGGKKTQKQIYI